LQAGAVGETLAEPPTVVSQCGNGHLMAATDLQNGLSNAVVQLHGMRSAGVQEIYAVSVQQCFCTRVQATSLIGAMLSSPFAGSIPPHANPRTYRPRPALAIRIGLRVRRRQQKRSLFDFAARAGKRGSCRGEHRCGSGPDPPRLLEKGARRKGAHPAVVLAVTVDAGDACFVRVAQAKRSAN